jgi:hypothetical protein
VAAPTTESENEPNRLPQAPKEWNELPDETVEYVKKYGDEILDTHIAFTGHSTPWKRSILVRSSKSKHDPITIQIEEKLDSNGKVVGRVSMVGGHLLVSVKQNHTIEEVLERVPNAVLTQSTKLTNTHLVQFEAQDAKKLDEMLQSFSDQKDLVERAVPNILFHLK